MRKINKKGICTSILDRFQMIKYFMQASCNMTGQKNGANIWITSEQSILRTTPLQDKWNDTQRCVIFGTIRNKWKEDPKKPSSLSSNNTGYCQDEQRSRSDSIIKKTTQSSRGSAPREARLAYMALSQLEMVLRGEPTLSIMENQKKSKPRETEKR